MSKKTMSVPETLFGLVKAYSPSGKEGIAVDYLVKRMQELHFTQAYQDEAGNAIGVMGDGLRLVVLLGHIDTVPGKIQVRVDGDNLYGRGSVDAKGPLAAFVDAVAQVGAVDGWQFVVIGAVEEERDSDGAQYAVSRYRPELAIIGEPNRWDRVALGYKGSAWAKLFAQQQHSHTAGVQGSACEAVIDAVQKIRAWAVQFNDGRERIFDQILLTVRKMESGDDGFEEWACLNIGARLPLDLDPQAWYARLRELVPDLRMDPLGFAIPAFQCEKNTVLVRALLSGIRSVEGKPSFVYKTGTADLNIVGPVWNCPAAVYGPGDSALDHTPAEHCSIEEFARAKDVLVYALGKLVLSQVKIK